MDLSEQLAVDRVARLDAAVDLATVDPGAIQLGELTLAAVLYMRIASERGAYLESLARLRPGAAGLGTWTQLLDRGFRAAGQLADPASSRTDGARLWLRLTFARATASLAAASTEVIRQTLPPVPAVLD
ncbi:MAG: hypothetical protein IT384_34870 [Deltaproteobacteria bacterium]|nr:hypothetical protein [Deltaproteobacteria bacterium]